MSDTSLNKFIQWGSAAARAAFTPDIPQIGGSDVQVLYIWMDDDNLPTSAKVYAWDVGAGDWIKIGDSAGITALTSDVTATGPGSVAATIANDAVTYAKMQDVTATARALGRNTAGSGIVEEVTMSQILDWVGSAAQGDILYRNATAWVRLAAGTAGHVLTTGGAGANPAWSASAGGGGDWALAGSTATTGTTATGSWIYSSNVTEVIFTDLANFTEVLLLAYDLTADASVSRNVQVSIDNGANWLAGTSYDYISDAGVRSTADAIGLHSTNTGSARGGSLHFFGWDLTAPKVIHNLARTSSPMNVITSANALSAIRIYPSSGNFTGGNIKVYAR